MKVTVFIDHKYKTMKFSLNGNDTLQSFDEWDENGSCVIDGLLMDYSIIFDEEAMVSVATLKKQSDGSPITRDDDWEDAQLALEPDEWFRCEQTNDEIFEEYTWETIEVVIRKNLHGGDLVAFQCGQLDSGDFALFGVEETSSRADYATYLHFTRPLSNDDLASDEYIELIEHINEDYCYNVEVRKRLTKKRK